MIRRTTLRDIAKVAGVHFTTVGRALRGDSRVRPEVAASILAIANKMDYRSDPLLSALSSYRRSGGRGYHGNIGYIFARPIENLSGGVWSAYLSAKRHAEERGFEVGSCLFHGEHSSASELRRVLRARGVQGVILAPLPFPGAYPDFKCDHLAVVAVGQSITAPIFHRVCNHQFHSVGHQMEELRRRGYRRIGLVLSSNGNIRTEGTFLGAYLATQAGDRAFAKIPPLITEENSPDRLEAWLKRYKPDSIIGSESETYEYLKKAGYSIPRDIGFTFLSKRDEYPKVAAADEDHEMLGELAVDLVISLMAKREYGIPKMPLTTLVENRNWNPGETVRSLPK